MFPEKTQFRAPVSESLSRLDRERLQKFAQYLLNELPKSHLSIAQGILDKLLGNNRDEMNILPGGPDPTAGSTCEEYPEWFMDNEALTDNIKRTIGKTYQGYWLTRRIISKILVTITFNCKL